MCDLNDHLPRSGGGRQRSHGGGSLSPQQLHTVIPSNALCGVTRVLQHPNNSFDLINAAQQGLPQESAVGCFGVCEPNIK